MKRPRIQKAALAVAVSQPSGQHGRTEDRSHLDFVRAQPCALRAHCNGRWCGGGIVAHHLLRPAFSTRGTGRRAGDYDTIPICENAHVPVLHARGDEDAFFAETTGDPDFGRKVARKLAQKDQAA